MKAVIEVIGGVRATILLTLLILAVVFGGWNYWRKNVYHDALNLTVARKLQDARIAEQAQRDALSDQATELQNQRDTRNDALQTQLNEIASRPPAERVVYKLQDRWLPVSCPAEAGSNGHAASYGGLQPADERFLIQFAHDADDVTLQLHACQAAVNELITRRAQCTW